MKIVILQVYVSEVELPVIRYFQLAKFLEVLFLWGAVQRHERVHVGENIGIYLSDQSKPGNLQIMENRESCLM